MTLGKKIKILRVEKGLTQETLAELLHVTAQAVSRWENEYVDPNIDTLKSMAQIFGVTVDELLSFDSNDNDDKESESIESNEPNVNNVTNIETNVVASADLDDVREIVNDALSNQKKQIALCCECNRPIYEGEEIHRLNSRNKSEVYCQECYEQHEALKKSQIEHNNKKWRTIAWVSAAIGLAAAIALTIFIGYTFTDYQAIIYGAGIPASLGFGMFLYCAIAKNNFMNDMFETVISWGFVKFPGLIFTFDIDGIFWLICMKILFFTIGFVLVTCFVALAVALGIVLSYFVFPFAVYRSYKRPELTEN